MMYAPVAPEMMYASPEQYAYPAAYPVYEQETSDWSNVAMLAVAGAVVGGVIGSKTKQGSTATQNRAVTARAGADEDKVAMLLFGGKSAAPKKNAFAYGLPGNFNALGGSELNWDPAGCLEGKAEPALRPGYVPGQIGFDPLGLAPEDPAEFAIMQEKELAHARLAMIAAAGFLAQEAVTKATWGTAYGIPD